MYNKDFLEKNDYFKNVNNDVLDPLTNCISRKYIIDYAKYLIENKIPFSLSIIDIDNFKLVNDSYGHLVGDEILVEACGRIMKYCDESQVVGRYGGDEFLIINTADYEYDDVWRFLKTIHRHVLKDKLYISNNLEVMTTITTGCAAYPRNAINYSDLFEMADKALYRGKQKGRNCFIIYIPEKHEKIDVSQRFLSMSYLSNEIYNIITKEDNWIQGAKKAFKLLCNALSLTSIICQSNEVKELEYYQYDYKINYIDPSLINELLDENGCFYTNDYSTLKGVSPILHEFCWNNKIKSIVINKLSFQNKNYGYLIVVDSFVKRIWQQSDICIFKMLANLISILISSKGVKNA